MGAKNMKQLEQQMMRQLRSAMASAALKSKEIMDEEIQGFYDGGVPSSYSRTKQLASTPEIDGLHTSSNSVSFTAKLDQSGGYTTGKQPSMAEVLQLTNYGSAPGLNSAVGSPGYWEKAEDRIKRASEEEIARAFK